MIDFVEPVAAQTTRRSSLLRTLFPGFLMSLALIVGCSDGSDHKPGATTPPEQVVPAALTSLAEDISEANHGRAAILHVSTASGNVWDVAAGLANVETGEEAEFGDQVEIGSASKVFLAVTVLRLVEQGLLDLDDPVQQWIDVEQLDALTGGNGAQVRLRHLLNHATGMGDYLNFTTDNGVMEFYGISGERAYAPEEHIQQAIEFTRNPVDTAPEYAFPLFTLQDANGQSYSDYDSIPFSTYSNTGYVMLGLIVQAVTGERYEDIIEQEVLDPLGLEDTGFGTDGLRADLTGYAVGLEFSGEQPVVMSPTLSWSAGQMVSTTTDLGRFLSGAISGETFDKPETLELWQQQYFKNLDGDIPYGLGIMKWEFGGIGTVFGHNGQVFGAVALMAYDVTTGNIYTAAVNNSQYVSVDGDTSPSIWELMLKMHQIAVDNP